MNAIDYFQSYINYFWVWEEEAEVLALPDGSTIAYSDEVVKIMSRIAENGLPPFGSILLGIIALQRTENDSLDFIHGLLTKLEFDYFLKDECLTKSFKFLELLKSLPEKYKTHGRKEILLQTVFENAHNRLNASTSKGIVAFLGDKRVRSKVPSAIVLNEKIVLKELKVLQLLSEKFTNQESIINALLDLPEMDDALLPELSTTTTSDKVYKDLVEELMDNPQTFEIAALVKPIWAGFKIPIFNPYPSEQPFGGVSDLSNKGDFHRLLISEFANDDLLFMSRLANNEALYLQREMPPASDKLQRIILIDVTLKTWGVPKILAHAFALAISKHPRSKSESHVYAVGHDFHRIEYDRIENTLDGVQKVALDLNASHGIEAFLKENKMCKNLEIFYITTPEGLRYPEITKILAENHALFKYLITADLLGSIHFYRNKNKSFKHLQTITLPIEKLWKKSSKLTENKIVIDPALDFSTPLLTPIPSKRSRMMPLGKEMYFVSNKFLFRVVYLNQTQSKKGCDVLLQNVPANAKYELGKTSNGQMLFLSFDPQKREITITDILTLQFSKATFHQWKSNYYSEFIFIRDHFTFLSRQHNLFSFKPDFETKIIEIIKEEYETNSFETPYLIRQKEISDAPHQGYAFNILKNLKQIRISEEGRLVFNGHSLYLGHDDNYFAYSSDRNLRKQYKSEANYDSTKRTFVFSDGSTIKADHKGFFVLRSANPNTATIYVSSTIDHQAGAATESHFAGLSYFYKVPYVTCRLISIGPSILEAVKIIRGTTGMGLKDVKEIVDQSPIQFSTYMSLKDAENMITDLRNVGCEATISCNTTEQKFLSCRAFYDKYIQEFIDQILQS